MFLLYHSEGCNICELVLRECYVNDLYTTTCSGVLSHHIKSIGKFTGFLKLICLVHFHQKILEGKNRMYVVCSPFYINPLKSLMRMFRINSYKGK
jgi:hypothetical protein